jgi:hypothetical protein
MRSRHVVAAFLALLVLSAQASAHTRVSAQGISAPPNDLLALGQGTGDVPDPAQIQKPPAPPIVPAPRAECGPGSRPEPDIQGRVPAGSASEGLWCNMTLISHHGVAGGFKVFDYVDLKGHECAFYDTALVFPVNAFNLDSSSLGVAVLDMADPANPVQTATLTDPAMLSPHESLNLNAKRGLLAAVSGNPSTYPGWVSIYDVSQDCRNPELQSSAPLARLGHESGFSEDGKTFYAAGTAYRAITAIDVTDPKAPSVVWHGSEQTHGMTLSADGNRAYLANPDVEFGDMIILDTSEIQARKPNPHAREISRMTWDRVSIPQNAIPFTAQGKPYVLEFDEYNASTLDPTGDPDSVGAARIIDISDERRPRIVSYLRLQVNEPAEHAQYGSDPGADGPAGGGGQGYAAHYCNIPTRIDPQLVACSFIVSGLRLFDISDIRAPKEVGYYVAPTQAKPENQGQASNYAMSLPAFVPDRREVWFTDATSGFYALRVADNVWPSTTRCLSRRSPIGPRNIGRVRLGYSRAQLLELPVPPVRRARRAFRYCVKGGRGRVTAVLSRRGRVRLVTTTARGHGNRRVRVGAPSRAFVQAFPSRRRVIRGIYRLGRRSGRVYGLRRGRVRFIAVSPRRLLRRPRTLRRYLRVAGL